MSKNENSGGIGFCGLLTIVFIVLKLTKVINWSWWWVLSPALIAIVITVALIFIQVSLEAKRYRPTMRDRLREMQEEKERLEKKNKKKSYYCKGKDCPKKSDCARYKAYKSFVNETGNDSAEGIWYADERICVNNNYSEGVLPE